MEGNLAILWKNYKTYDDICCRDRLISNYQPFVKSIVHHVHAKLPRSVDIMDLEGYAYVGLMEAINKFDLNRMVKFETYAGYRIKGAIIDGIRRQDWLSRSLRSKNRKIREEIYDEEHEDHEKSREKDIYGEFSLVSMDDPDFYEKRVEESTSDIEKISDIYALDTSGFEEKLENRLFLKKALSKLSLQEKKIIYMYYIKGLTFKEIGRSIGISESRVSQINKNILLFLKKEMKKTL